MKQYYKIEIQPISQEQSDILISELSDLSFYAFEEEENKLIGYINEVDFNENDIIGLIPADSSFTKEIIEDKNWNEQWESDFQPVIVHDFVAIRAGFHQPVKGVKHDLQITPKMSFGTGHHATTFSMVELMESIDFSDKKVFDFGTGTGVLAILAEKLGAANIYAIDIDEWSITNTLENIEANGCSHITVEQKSDLSELSPFDIILANINLNILKGFSKELTSLVKQDGLLLTSGFLPSDIDEMVAVFSECGFLKMQSTIKNNWAAILFVKK